MITQRLPRPLPRRAASAGQSEGSADVYPGRAKTALKAGLDDIEDWFETLAKAERSYANRFHKALDSLDE